MLERFMDLVDNTYLREQVMARGIPVYAISTYLGWNDNRLRACLGLRTFKSSKTGKRYIQKRMSYENATAIAKALNIDPVECGL